MMWWHLCELLMICWAMGWYPCCCAVPECEICTDVPMPSDMTIEITGVVDSFCTTCERLNGTFTLPHVGVCSYELTYTTNMPDFEPGFCRQPDRVRINLHMSTGSPYIEATVKLQDTGAGYECSENYHFDNITLGNGPHDCCTDLVGVNIPPRTLSQRTQSEIGVGCNNSLFACSIGSANIEITALTC